MARTDLAERLTCQPFGRQGGPFAWFCPSAWRPHNEHVMPAIPPSAALTNAERPAEPRVLNRPREWGLQHYCLFAIIGLLLGLRRAESDPDADVFWSTRYGLDFLSSGHLARSDTYSWTATGRHWVPNSWGWNIVLGAAYRVAGLGGLWIVGVLTAVLVCAALAESARRIGASALPTALAVAALGPFLLVSVPRAQAVGYPLMLCIPFLMAALLFPEGKGDAWRALGLLTLLEIVWMNIHSSALLGPIVAGAAGIGLIFERRGACSATKTASALLAGVLAMCVAALVTPYGTATITNVAEVHRASAGLIKEWAKPGLSGFGPISALVLIGIGLVAAFIAWRARRFGRVAILLALVGAAATAVRFAPMLTAFAIPELATGLSQLDVRPHMMRRIVALGCAALTGLVLSSVNSLGSLSDYAASRELVSKLPHGCRLLNDYIVGDAVILFRRDVKVSTDSRNDMYGREAVLANLRALNNGPAAERYVDDHQITCVLAYTEHPLVQHLRRSNVWHIVGADSQRTLLVRR